jgi:hypothetical protein
MANTSVRCPECHKTHPWPVCNKCDRAEGCTRATKLEQRLASFYYTKAEIDERLGAVLEVLHVMNVSRPANHLIAELRSRFLA